MKNLTLALLMVTSSICIAQSNRYTKTAKEADSVFNVKYKKELIELENSINNQLKDIQLIIDSTSNYEPIEFINNKPILKINPMKIFEFKSEETDWVFADDIEEATECYLIETGCGDGDLKRCKIEELPKEKWKDHYILDPNETEPEPDEEDYNEEDYSCGYLITGTFEDYAKTASPPEIFCTTAF